MATELARQDYSNPDQASFVIPLVRQPAAGNTIIFTAGGGAISTPTGFERVGQYDGGNQDTSIWWRHADGTETEIDVSNNGPENTGGCVLQYAETLEPLTFSDNGHGATPDVSTDFQITAPPLTVTEPALLITMWSASQSTPYSEGNRFRPQIGPLGEMVSTGHLQGGAGLDIIFATGVADLDPAKSYPAQAAAGSFTPTAVYRLGALCFVAAAAFADPSGVPSVPAPANRITEENLLPGAAEEGWYLNTDGLDDTIAGFSTRRSWLPGDTATFKVDSGNTPFRGRVYRLGWYGDDGFSARHVLGNQGGYLVGTPVAQPDPVEDPVLGSFSCAGWTANLSWDIPSDAAPGLYSIIFERTDVAGHLAAAHFVIREASVTGKIPIVIPDLTAGAYNRARGRGDSPTTGYGGRSLYGDSTSNANFAGRAYAVDFNRPWAVQADNGSTYIYDSIFGFVVFAEMMGYDVTYLSDMDIEDDPTILTDAALVCIVGHHEYWTTNIIDGITAARDARVNILFATANTSGWRVRFDPADTEKSTAICYKDSGTRDVGPGWIGTGYDPDTPTGTWRDPLPTNGIANPDQRFEEALTGQRFVASGPVQTPYVFPAAAKTVPCFRASPGIQGLTTGQTLIDTSNSVGFEVDSPDGSPHQPTNLANLVSTDVAVTSGANAAGTIYTTSATVTAAWTIYRADSGALVVNVGWRGLRSATRWQGSSRVASSSIDVQAAFAALMHDLGAVAATPTNVLQPGTDTAVPDVTAAAPGPGNDAVARAYGLTTTVETQDAVSLSAEPTMGAGASVTRDLAVTLSSTPALAAAAGLARHAAAQLETVAGFGSIPTLAHPRAVQLSAAPSLSASLNGQGVSAVDLDAEPLLSADAGAGPPGAVVLTSEPTLTLAAAPVITRHTLGFDFAPAPPRWRFAVITGIRMLTIDRDATEYVPLNAGVPPDVSVLPDVVEFAFISAGDPTARPADSDWHAGEWFATPTKLIARVLIGPDVLALAPDLYVIWVRVTDNPERPLQRAGHLVIT